MKQSETTIPPRKKKDGVWSHPIPTLTIMTHVDPGRIGERALLEGLVQGHTVALSRVNPTFSAPDKILGKPLDDPFISRNPLFLRRSHRGGVHLDPGEGKIEVLTDLTGDRHGWHFHPEHISQGVVLTLAGRMVLLLHWSHVHETVETHDHGMIGHSDPIRFLRREIERVADLETPVLLLGASGSGKELAARAIHQAGRPEKPFISVNLGAIPDSLAASELFGAVKGSFTGADRSQTGYFRAADGGTLFLDEVGEASLPVQVMLLRALETGEISPVGAQVPIKVNTRLIAATDADLEEKMAQDSFKTPLFHRLAGYVIKLPTLCQRLEDLPRLFMHFAKLEMVRLGDSRHLSARHPEEDPWLPPRLMERFLKSPWPGNVRQLRNVVRQITIGCRGEPVLHSVPELENMLDTAHIPNPPSLQEPAIKRKPATVPEQELVAALRQNRWNIKASAAQLGISRSALYLLIEKTPGLRKASDISASELREGLARHDGDVIGLGHELGISPRSLRRRITQLELDI